MSTRPNLQQDASSVTKRQRKYAQARYAEGSYHFGCWLPDRVSRQIDALKDAFGLPTKQAVVIKAIEEAYDREIARKK